MMLANDLLVTNSHKHKLQTNILIVNSHYNYNMLTLKWFVWFGLIFKLYFKLFLIKTKSNHPKRFESINLMLLLQAIQ